MSPGVIVLRSAVAHLAPRHGEATHTALALLNDMKIVHLLQKQSSGCCSSPIAVSIQNFAVERRRGQCLAGPS